MDNRIEIDVNLVELLVAAIVTAARTGVTPVTVVIDTDKEVVEARNALGGTVAEVPF